LRRLLANAALALGGVLVVLVAAEVGVRVVVPEQFSSPLVHVWDKKLALRQVAGARGEVVTPEFKTRVAINSKGLRDREYPYDKPAATRRILCIGDSFTFGYGVEVDQTFAKQLEAMLGREAGAGNWEVINAGVPGTGTAHHLAYYDLEGCKYSPDYVLLCFCGKNDFNDNIKCGLYSLEGGVVVRHEARLSSIGRIRHLIEQLPGYRGLFRRSKLLMLVGHRLTLLVQRRSTVAPGDQEALGQRRRAACGLTEGLIVALRDSCASRGAVLIFTVAPQIEVGEEAADVESLEAFVDAKGIERLDLEPAFRAEAARGNQCFYPVDHHWNTLGHRLVARQLADFFLARP
jgi:hypothetical protein